MARKHDAVRLLKEGFPPSQIAKRFGVSVATIMGYLYNQVGEGQIRRSDIVFAIPRNTRAVIESLIPHADTEDPYRLVRKAREVGKSLSFDDVKVYLDLRDARLALGDMYEIIRDIEVSLHTTIHYVLRMEYKQNWWREGIPDTIRAECAASSEIDPEPASNPYCYTTLIHLKEILDKRWDLFSKVLPQRIIADKRVLLSGLVKLNRIRNKVMHPVKGQNPTEEDFQSVREFQEYLDLEQWRTGALKKRMREIVEARRKKESSLAEKTNT